MLLSNLNESQKEAVFSFRGTFCSFDHVHNKPPRKIVYNASFVASRGNVFLLNFTQRMFEVGIGIANS